MLSEGVAAFVPFAQAQAVVDARGLVVDLLKQADKIVHIKESPRTAFQLINYVIVGQLLVFIQSASLVISKDTFFVVVGSCFLIVLA